MSAEEKKLKILEKKKEMFFLKLQTIYDLGRKAGTDPSRMKDFMMRARTLEFIKTQFLSIMDDINETQLELKDNYDPNYQAVDAFDEMYYVAYDIYQAEETKRQTELTLRGIQGPAVRATDTQAGPKLQRIVLPTFSGNAEEWPLFHQLFVKLVHEHPALTDIERVTHLVTHLSGSAKSVCTSVSPTAENYNLILQTLIDRFEDKRSLASAYIEKLLNFKQLQGESDKNLDTFLANFVEPVNALKKMGIEDLADYLFLHIGLKKLDSASARLFEHSIRSNKELPQFKTLVTFVTEQARILGREDNSKKQSSKSQTSTRTNNSPPTKGPLAQNYVLIAQDQDDSSGSSQESPSKEEVCPLCPNESHALYSCPAFKKMSVDDRWSLVQGGRCYNCLSSMHFSRACKSVQHCRVSGCTLRHHTLLHRIKTDKSPTNPPALSLTSSIEPSASSTSASELDGSLANPQTQSYCSTSGPPTGAPSSILLATVVVFAKDAHGKMQELRGILDAGSQSHFLTLRACRRLGLPQNPIRSVVKGIGSSPLNVSSCATLSFHSRVDSTLSYTVQTLVVHHLSDRIPSAPISKDCLTHLCGIPLSDEEFHKPHEVDLLIGAELWPLIVGARKVTGPPNSPIALETTLGYVVMGRANIDTQAISTNAFCSFNQLPESMCMFVEPTLEEVIRKFWELEDVPKRQLQSIEDSKCDRFFMDTYVRNADGTFTVRLPFSKPPSLLGSSLESSVAQFLALERRLLRNQPLRELYVGMIQEYAHDGTISRVGPVGSVNHECAYYMPHHGVYRPNHPTTPLRIVFNASAPTSTSVSLNNILFVGPKLHANMFSILIHFRLFRFVATSDVKRMFLRINVAPEDRRFQRFVWRSSPNQPLAVYEINKVVFGGTSSPYLANKVLRILSDQEKSRYPLASAVAQRDVYVDDVITSIDTEEELVDLYNQLTAMFASGGLSLSKWVSNSARLMEMIPNEFQLLPMVDFDQNSTSKILGVQWLTQTDAFTCVIDQLDSPCTKRHISSVIAHIFDPLGLVAPVTVKAKGFLKTMWKLNLDWDATPPQPIVDEWNEFKTSLPLLRKVSVPRHIGITKGAYTILVGFSDSSEEAYGACVYIRSNLPEQEPVIGLLCAKSKIAPAKVVTIPRLELCAALMLSQLMRYVIDSYESRHTFDRVIAFTDSKVTLHWIQSDPSRWKIFVGNRLAQLQENVAPHCWRHVPGEENPADVLSRGISPEGLLQHPLWFNGPGWLKDEESCWPQSMEVELPCAMENEEKQVKIALLATSRPVSHLLPLLDRVSSLRRLLRATAYVFRAVTCTNLRIAFIKRQELDNALNYWIKLVQAQHFPKEIAKLNAGQPIHSSLRHLDPFLHEGVLRVGGRLANAPLAFDHKFPILLPSNGTFVDLLIDQYHIDLLHAGQHLLISQLRQKYWVLSARSSIRSRIHRCNTCFRVKPKPVVPKMAPLPGFRVEGSRPFERVGIDYAGPFTVTPLRRRGQRTLTKAYICVFICLAVKAIHIELASDLSTDCFLAAYKRFLARRGPCSLLLSDGGTNFIGARRKLSELEGMLTSGDFQSRVGGELAHRGVEWRINPAYGPWFGGIWEANIKSIKGHLKRFIGEQILTYEELNTVIVQIEAVLNSRPLCVLNNDPNSPTALTPNHFLNPGATLDQLPSQNLRDAPFNRLTRYELIDRIVQDYWERWRNEYLQTLQSRAKWTKETAPISVGTVVVIWQDNVPPLRWPLGVVEEIHPGGDGNVRVASVRTCSGVYRRPVGRLCPLPTQ